MTRLSYWLWLLAVLCLFGYSSFANALTVHPAGRVGIEYLSNGVRFVDPNGATHSFIGRSFAPQTGTGGVDVLDVYKQRVGGHDINVQAKSAIPKAAAARAGALALRALPVVGTGLFLWDLYDSYRIRPDGQGGLVYDPGLDPFTGTVMGTEYRFTSTGAWKGTVMDAFRARFPLTYSNGCANFADPVVNGLVVTYKNYYPLGGPNCNGVTTGSVTAETRQVQNTVTECPTWSNGFKPQPGLDNKCPKESGPTEPITVDEVATKLDSSTALTPERVRQIVEDALARNQPIEAPGTRTLSGPGSQVGQQTTTTTTKPDGTTRTETKTPTTTYTYSSNQVTYNVTNQTVINEGGQTTVINEEAPPEEADACKDNPSRLGCVDLGEPDAEGPEWETKDVSFQPIDLGFGGGCPAPVTWSWRSIDLAWSYQPVCDVAPMIRLAILACVSIGCIGIIVRETTA